MPRASTPWWQQATALVSLSAGGAITGFSFVPKAAVDFSSPTSLPVNLLALQHSVRQAPASDAALRTAIVNVAQHYLQLAQDKTPAEMEAMIWQQDSLDHADHGPSCAAFASLTLELAAKVVGQQSWVSGGSSYPWPLHTWADVRVDENPASPGIISIQQDAQTHGRWHPLGDGYQPQPGDWVLFNGHVEVVTEFAHGVLHTIGGDSLPNFSVNAHQYPDPLAGDGVAGFVNNGSLSSARPAATASTSGTSHAGHRRPGGAGTTADTATAAGQAAIPGAAPASPATPGSAASPHSAATGTARPAGTARATGTARRARPRRPVRPPGWPTFPVPGGPARRPGRGTTRITSRSRPPATRSSPTRRAGRPPSPAWPARPEPGTGTSTVPAAPPRLPPTWPRPRAARPSRACRIRASMTRMAARRPRPVRATSSRQRLRRRPARRPPSTRSSARWPPVRSPRSAPMACPRR